MFTYLLPLGSSEFLSFCRFGTRKKGDDDNEEEYVSNVQNKGGYFLEY